ncbi:unnamed protein product [Ilex paraguariensis]|uniref:Tetratricopeptide repeat protein SKI3 n=1 Tax=Ilex paraguariensis TaxID=185542 RepID=A0ABC8UDC2_9AQUA
MNGEDEAVLRQLQQSADSHPDDPSLHFNLGVLLWEKGENSKEIKEIAAEHFVISAKLNPQNGPAFRYLGHYYSRISVDTQRALKCYQRAITLNADDSDSGEAICDLLDGGGKESLEISVCREASEKSPRAFWAFRRLGYLQVHHKKWSEAVQSLQHAIRGYPTCADLWEALGLAYQRLGKLTAAIKSYGRATEMDDSRVFALVESANIFLMLGSFRKGIEQFQQALHISPQNVAAHYGLAFGLLSLSKECINSGAFRWGASLLEEASEVAKTSTCFACNLSSMWKLCGDIQLTYAKCFPWMEEGLILENDEKAFNASILSWKRTCTLAALSASHFYQKALHLAPWEANIYVDIAITSDLIYSLKESCKQEMNCWQLPEKMAIGGLLLEGDNNEFWVALGCLSSYTALKQHALIRGLQLDVSLAVAWAYLGTLYRKGGKIKLAQQAFDRARSIDPSLALPWAGMSADTCARVLTPDDAYECCLRAVQILPLAEFQIGLAKLALLSGHLSSSQVFGAVRQSLQRAPHYPETHNLNGLVFEARFDYLSAVASYRLARCAISSFSGKESNSYLRDVSINLARSLCMAGKSLDAVQECENLKEEGLLDSKGLQIYALSLWQLGKNDMALSVTRILAESVLSTERTSAMSCITFILRLVYYVSGQESAISNILKMAKELYQSPKIGFVALAIHALDQSDRLESLMSSSHSSLASHGNSTGMHFLIAIGKLVKHGSKDWLGIQDGVNHLRKALHMFPNSVLLRNLLGYLLLSSKESKDTHIATRCFSLGSSDCPKEEGLKSGYEILGARAVACYTTGNCETFSFTTCSYQWPCRLGAIQQLQKWLHQEPWNHNARYLLILSYLQKAREERYPQHLCVVLERLISVAVSNELFSKKDMSYQYQKFQILLCASEISLQVGDHIGSIKQAKTASGLSLPNDYLFFAHLQLCRAYAAEANFISLRQEYIRCLELKTDYHIGWICLKFIESRNKLQTDSTLLALSFEECSKVIKISRNMWMAVYSLVQGLIAVWSQDFHSAEEFLAKACSLVTTESCLFLCHGAICMELAREQCDSHFLSLAVRSLKKAKKTSIVPLPYVSMLLAQAEASLGSQSKWEEELRVEWFSWPSEMRPAELFFQMHLLSRRSIGASDSLSDVESCQSSMSWMLRAIHLNPSCSRYWKALQKVLDRHLC